MKGMRDFRSQIDCLPGALSTRNSGKTVNKENCNPTPIMRQTATTYERAQLGLVQQEKVKAAKTYDRNMKIIEPSTYSN